MRRVVLPWVIALAFAIPVEALAQSPEGSPSRGRGIATAVCSRCHKVIPTNSSSTEVPPSFEDIANRPSTTKKSLNVFLSSEHNLMPDFVFSESGKADVVAYILSLKR